MTSALAVAALLVAAPVARPAPLGDGPCAKMSMLLERTIFKVDVLTVAVRVDEETAGRIRELARGPASEERTRDAIARAIIDSETAAIELRFERDVDLDRFLEAVRESLEEAREAGMISAAAEREVSRLLPQWFRPVAERGFQDGDRLRYGTAGDRVETTLQSSQGEVLLQRVDRGADRTRALLASHFAPGTEFREPLLDSVVDCAGG